jgi:hypothetical protein
VSRVDEITEVRVRRLNRDTTIVLPNGSGPVFTANSQWLAYTIGGSPAEREKLEKEKKPVRSSTGIVELSNGARTTIAQSSRSSRHGRPRTSSRWPRTARRR